MHLVVLADGSPGQLDGLGDVSLEVQAEGAPFGEGVRLALEVSGEALILKGDYCRLARCRSER